MTGWMSAKARSISSARCFRAALSAGSASGCFPAGRLNPSPLLWRGWPAGDVATDESLTDEPTTEAFEGAVADLDYPMMIVTAAAGDERAGCLVGFGAQCSISPPRFMVWLSKRNHTYRIAQRADVLAVHFPSSADTGLAELFGTTTGDDVDKFAACRWRAGPGGAPVLEGVSRWFAGSITERLDSGDHVAFMLDPVAGGSGSWPGQLGFQALRDLRPGHSP